MKRVFPTFIRLGQMLAIVLLALGTYLLMTQASGLPTTHALPEYSPRTGEPCGVCHVSAGGGGPRTMRGLLWAARGRSDEVPELEGMSLAPNITYGEDLYDVACAGCHGSTGEGLFAINLVGTNISLASNQSFIRYGIPELEMPAFDGKLSDEQIMILADYVTQLSNGKIQLQHEYQLPPPEFGCDPVATAVACGGDE
jgi:cytochrome c553